MKKRRVVSLMIAVCMVVTMLTGCASSNSNTGSQNTGNHTNASQSSNEQGSCSHAVWNEFNEVAHQCASCGVKESHVWAEENGKTFCSICFAVKTAAAQNTAQQDTPAQQQSVPVQQEESSQQEESVPAPAPVSCEMGMILSNYASRYSFSSASASSELSWGGKTYGAYLIIDNSAVTDWQEAKTGTDDGIGEWVKLDFQSSTKINVLQFNMGNQHSYNEFMENNAPKSVTLEFSGGESVQCTFEHFFDTQYVYLSRPVETTYVKVIINSVYNGTLYHDTAISEACAFYDSGYEPDNGPNQTYISLSRQIYVQAGGIYARKGPGKQYDTLLTLYSGTVKTIDMATIDGKWGHYQENGTDYWIFLGLVFNAVNGASTGEKAYHGFSETEFTHDWRLDPAAYFQVDNLLIGPNNYQSWYRCSNCGRYRMVLDGAVYTYVASTHQATMWYYGSEPDPFDYHTD